MARPVEKPIPRSSLLAQLIRDSRAAGVPPRDAELAIWRSAIKSCRGNAALLSAWMQTDPIWTRRHLTRLGLQDELAAARSSRRKA